MTTPICDFVKKYLDGNNHRLHMPGHKGKSFLGFEGLDITEIEGADVLYHAEGIIRESEQNAADLFGTARTLYSTEGSSLSIRAMVYLLSLYAVSIGKKPHILAARNAHKAFIMAVALSDVCLSFLYGEEDDGLVSCRVTPEALDKALSSMQELPTAVYITSPDYLGNVADIEGLSAVCKSYGVILAVDNAHGAYLRFLPESRHPIDLGADICCDSAHKTLPVLTGGGYLHISKNAPSFFAENADRAMTVFSSTSPSYLILQSLDYANKYLSEGYRDSLARMCKKVAQTKERLASDGISLCGDEALKITVATKDFGRRGDELSAYLEKNHNIYAEFSDPDYIVFMVTPETDNETLVALETALTSVQKKSRISEGVPKIPKLQRAISARQALYSPCEEIDIEHSAGRILASPTVSCPPAIPIAVCGEILTDDAIRVMEYYGCRKIVVVKQ